MGGTYTRATCPQCGSADTECDTETCKCRKCEYVGPKRDFGKYHGSYNCDFDPPSQSVPRRNKRRQKGQRRIWKPGNDE